MSDEAWESRENVDGADRSNCACAGARKKYPSLTLLNQYAIRQGYVVENITHSFRFPSPYQDG